jgi:hypothetical protein
VPPCRGTALLHLGTERRAGRLGGHDVDVPPPANWSDVAFGERTSTPTGSKVYLPFEEDGRLSVILSKAFLLAEDEAITDPDIVSQIRSPLGQRGRR